MSASAVAAVGWSSLLPSSSRTLEDVRAAAALLIDRLDRTDAGQLAPDGAGPGAQSTAVAVVERLLDLGLHEQALELIRAAGRHDGRVAAAARVAAELWRIHFGRDAGVGRDDPIGREGDLGRDGHFGRNDPSGILRADGAVAGGGHPAVVAALVAARLRPHARGSLGSWERALLKELLS